MTDNGTLVAVSGMGSAAHAAAHQLIAAGARALISWGMAGGLDPALDVGTVCLPRVIVARDGANCATDLHWREILTAAIAGRRTIATGQLLTCDAAIDDIAGKAAAFRETGAVAVDMESLHIGQAAAAHQIPFIAVRVIVDTAHDVIPAAVMAASRGGHVHLPLLCLGLLRRPRDLAPLLHLAKRYRTAARCLAAIARTDALAPLTSNTPSRSRVA